MSCSESDWPVCVFVRVCMLTSAGYPGLCHSTVKWERAVWQQQRLRRQPGEWERRPQPPTGSCCQKACKLLHTAGLWNDSCGSSSSRSQKKNNGAKHIISLASAESFEGSLLPPTVVISGGFRPTLSSWLLLFSSACLHKIVRLSLAWTV